MAKESLFESREQPAKASVILKLKRNRPLRRQHHRRHRQPGGASVEGLRPEAVVIIDNNGRPLARPSGDGDEPLGAAVMERQQRIERELASEVVALLEPIVGADRVRVNVTLRLNTKTRGRDDGACDPATRRAQPPDHARGRRRRTRPAASPARAATCRARRSRRRRRRR